MYSNKKTSCVVNQIGAVRCWLLAGCLLYLCACRAIDERKVDAAGEYIALNNDFLQEAVGGLASQIHENSLDEQFEAVAGLYDSAVESYNYKVGRKISDIEQVITAAERSKTLHQSSFVETMQPGWGAMYNSLVSCYQIIGELPAICRVPDGQKLADHAVDELRNIQQTSWARFNMDKDSLAAAPVDRTTWMHRHFSGASAAMVIAMLHKMKRDLLLAQHAVFSAILSWQSQQSSPMQPVLCIDKSIVRNQDSLTIRAAVMSFRQAAIRNLSIDGKKQQPDPDHPGCYLFPADRPPGKYVLSIGMRYRSRWSEADADTFNTRLTYTIVP